MTPQLLYNMVYFIVVPASAAWALSRFARHWLWCAPILSTVVGFLMAAVALGGFPSFATPGGLAWWTLQMPAQQMVSLSITLGFLLGNRWGGMMGVSGGGFCLLLGFLPVAATGLPIILYPACMLLFLLVLALSFTGKARKAWDEYKLGNQ